MLSFLPVALLVFWLNAPVFGFFEKKREYPKILDLNGTWEAMAGEASPSEIGRENQKETPWKRVAVPGHAVNQGLPDGEVYTYVKGFSSPECRRGERYFICFEAVDYQADVWLNGHSLGSHQGYFQPFKFEVLPQQFKGAGNALVVRVVSLKDKDTLNKREIKGVLSHHDTRPGGAWSERGSERTTAGIWGGVYLKITGSAVFQDTRLDYDLDLGQSRATSSFSTTIHHSGKRAKRFELLVDLRPLSESGVARSNLSLRKKITLNPGVNAIALKPVLHEVALWWPFELGKPEMYQLTYTVLRRGIALDSKREEVGFRDIRWHADSHKWTVNGVRFFLRGTNYIGSLWLAQFSPSQIMRDVLLMKQAHINAVRVHAHITAPEFYRACNREGLLLWQDFPLQWGYEDSEAFTASALRQCGDMVSVLGNHPSIFAWCPHNEPPWDASWMTYKYPNYRADQNKVLGEKMVATLKMADSKRYVHPHSATIEHPWFGWYSGNWRDYGKPTTMTLISEFGAQALPGEETLRRIFPAKHLFPKTEDDWHLWEFHNFQPKETFKNAAIEQGETLDAFIGNTQDYQSRLIQKAVESYRLQRFSPVSAIFQFMFVEHWPSINWGIVDYQRIPKLGWHALRRSYQPILPIATNPGELLTSEINPGTLEIWVVNDLPTRLSNARLELSLGTEWVQTWTVEILPDEKMWVARVKLPDLPEGSYQAWMRLVNAMGEEIAVNQWPFQIREEALP